MTSHVVAYQSTELLFGTTHLILIAFFDDFNCVFTQIRCLSRLLLLLQVLLTAHDDIIDRNYEELPTINPQLNMELQPGFNNVNDQ